MINGQNERDEKRQKGEGREKEKEKRRSYGGKKSRENAI